MTTTDPRRTEYLPLAALKPDPANPKAHDMEALDASVGRFGFVEGITLDERTGYIVAGHGRHKALTDMEARGETPPEGVTVSKDGDWLVPVQRGWSSRTDAEARAYLIASNRTSELGGWVDDSLLSALDELDGDFTGVGFGEDDLDDLRAKLETVQDVSESSQEMPDFQPVEDAESTDFGTLNPRPCQKCGYDTANNPENLNSSGA